MHRNDTTKKRQKREAVLTGNGRQRALQSTIVGRPLGAMFVHKVREIDVLRLQSVRIEVIADLVHVHGDPVFSRSIGVLGVARDCSRVRIDDLR